eukprot:2270571-Amphidinium_carterae.1
MPWPTPQSWSFGITLKQEESGAWFQAEEVDLKEQAADQELGAEFPRRDTMPCCFCRRHGRWRQCQ